MSVSTPHTPPHALIVGAGIGGLAAALALRRAGWPVRVLERAESPRELGFALLLAPNAVHALRQIGVADAVLAGGHQVAAGEMRRLNGDLLRRFDVSRVRDLVHEPVAMVLRPVLHGALLDALGADSLMLGSRVSGYSTAASGAVRALLADGRSVSGRVLIGADGVGSAIRRQLHPHEPPPRSSGLFGLRGVAHGVAHHLGDADGGQYVGPGIEAGFGRAGGTTVYWYMSLPRRVVADASRDPARVIERAAAEFDDRFRRIVLATRRDDMRLDELFDRDPVAAWGQGPVTLLGDAAHPMLPHAGQGAAQALEDAVALGRALTGAADPVSALREYERRRARRSAAIVRMARRLARFTAVENPILCRLRDVLIRSMPERMLLQGMVSLGRPAE
jgi:2-polyprenyl-6-methoxyphenol hydroxylase-like FAD-dependent oxidoreductase